MTDKTIKYNGYCGSIVVDLEGGIMHGKILHIRDLVTFEAESVDKLKGEFKAAVDDYLDTCTELNKDPGKPYTGSFNVRIGPELHRGLAILAANQGKKLNQVVLEAVRAKLNPKVDEVHVNHDHEVKLTVNMPSDKVETYVSSGSNSVVWESKLVQH